jgi:serine/threonine protein phosphatase PrpC
MLSAQQSAMELEYWAATDVGRRRTRNEDNFLVDGDLRLFVVADGMGGHAAGEIASSIAVSTVREMVAREADLLSIGDHRNTGDAHLEICTLLEYAIHIASERIFDRAQVEPEKSGMGTTVIALLVVGNRGYIAHVGDSRIYLLRSGLVYQLTEDHSMMNEMIRRGTLRPGDFESGPLSAYKRAMTRAVGPGEAVEVDTLDLDILPGDALLLCTDGLYDTIEDNELARILHAADVREIPARLIDLANLRGGKDNITAIVVRAPNPFGSATDEVKVSPGRLRKIALFEQLSNQQLGQVADHMRVIEAAVGQVIFREGDPGQAMYMVLHGSIEIRANGTLVATVEEGGIFGEMALIDDSPRSATAEVSASCELACLGREEFQAILHHDCDLAVPILWSLLQITNERLRRTTQAAVMPQVEIPSDATIVDFQASPPCESMTDQAEAISLNETLDS